MSVQHLAAVLRVRQLAALLRRYLDNHCAASDQEGMSALCECRLCLATRAALDKLDDCSIMNTMTTQFQVFHKIAATWQDLTEADRAAFPQGFALVAAVDAEAPGQVFQLTNHIDSDWTTNPGVTLAANVRRARSSSVGDVFVDVATGVRYAVDGIGLTEF